MTLNEIAYMLLEEIRANSIVDDEKIDLRLVKAWIHLKRATFLKNVSSNPSHRINLNNYQTLSVTMKVNDNAAIHEYPYDDTNDPNRQPLKTVTSTTKIPTVVENKSGPIVYSVESADDELKPHFPLVSFDQLKMSGNGRFNTNLIFSALRDDTLYCKYNSFFDTITSLKLRAIFNDPTEVTGFDDKISRYPCSYDLIEYLKNAIIKEDIPVIFATKSDVDNDSSGEING